MTPYVRPAYQVLLARIESDLSAMPVVLRQPLAAMWARACSGMHGHLDWIAAQCSPLTCELERLYDWAALYHVDRLLATAAEGSVLATGNVGSRLLAGTLMRGQNELDYVVLTAKTLVAGNTSVSIRCQTKGIAGNLVSGQTLTLIDPVAGVNSTLTVGNLGVGGGEAEELLNTWRARVADEWRTMVSSGGRSGKPADYRFWAKSAHPSVTGAIVQPHALGAGSVLVRPVCNGLLNRLPTQTVLDAVSAYLATIAPAVSDYRVAAPVVSPVTLTMHLLPAVDTAANRAAIFDALDTLVLSKVGTDLTTLQLLWAEVDTAISTITSQYTLDESVAIVWAAHEVPVLRPISWV
ncbi:MAG: baseplate J/gp47 family protein [Nitrosomonadales bacterium]|nr:baseplate J/gp47 family protein [Nitrosomonadales bacterium]